MTTRLAARMTTTRLVPHGTPASRTKLGALVVVACAGAFAGALAGCGPKIAFGLSARDNDAAALDQVLAQRRLPARPAPINTAGTPRVFAVTGGAGHAIVAFDLAAGRPLWTAPADVESRVSVGGDFIVAREAQALVARDQARGAPRWSIPIAGTFIGAAADRDRAYLVTQSGQAARLAAYDGATGRELWKADAAGALGAPAAHGGVVYAPFLSQWLVIVDGATGAPRTRIRGVDEEISMLRVTSTAAYFGSKQGVFLLDHRAATGKRGDASYRQLPIPAELERTTYGRDAYSAAQVTYSAADRARVLWSALPTAQGAMRLAGDGYAIHYFRFVLGFAADGALRWAYSHPRVELVASELTGAGGEGVIAGVSAGGELIALDPATGAVRAHASLGTTSPVIGATFDADGWSPGTPAPAGAASDPAIDPAIGPAIGAAATVAALAAIAHDRDARFDRVKQLAVRALAALPDAGVTPALLAILGDDRAADPVKDLAGDALARRRDPAGLAALTAALAVHTDYLAGTEPAALGAVTKAITGLGGLALDPADVARALAALITHLDAPATSVPELVHVIGALAAIGGGASARRCVRTWRCITPTTSSAPTRAGSRRSSRRSPARPPTPWSAPRSSASRVIRAPSAGSPCG